MTTAISTTTAFPRFAFRIASTRMAKVVVAFVLVASLMLNGYFYFAASTINNDLVEAGIVQPPASTSLVAPLPPQITALGGNVTTVAISAGQAAAAAQQLQAPRMEAQAALAAGAR